jgi:ArsR family transcriptional regulator, arsenate/arsenite/antimonite-responsive transcriptional repressor
MTKPNPTLRSMTPVEERLAGMLKALGNPVRFQIVQILAEKQMCITGEIVEFTTLAQSTVSQHLKVLREAGLVRGDLEGPATCYCLDTEGLRWLKEQIGNWLPGCCGPEPAAEGQLELKAPPPAPPADNGPCC